MKTKKYVAKTFKGLEGVLRDELKALGADKVRVLTRAVEFETNKEGLYKINYGVRTALSILEPIFSFTANNEREFYEKVKSFPWYRKMKVSNSFLITKTVKSEVYTHSHYIALKMKDAIVDKFREDRGKRPDIDTDNPDIKFHLKINGTKCAISIDTSGDALFKRGYRSETNQAPINECLAAGLLSLSGWDKKSDLMDPTCGSGTLIIEAAMMSRNIPSGYFRKQFGFMNFKDFDVKLWEKVKQQMDSNITRNRVMLYGYDISEQSIRIARDNITKLGDVKRSIRIKKDDAREVTQPLGCEHVIFNPPYGERLSDQKEVIALYNDIYENFKANFKHCYISLLSSNFEALSKFKFKSIHKHKVLNGSLDCEFLTYKC